MLMRQFILPLPLFFMATLATTLLISCGTISQKSSESKMKTQVPHEMNLGSQYEKISGFDQNQQENEEGSMTRVEKEGVVPGAMYLYQKNEGQEPKIKKAQKIVEEIGTEDQMAEGSPLSNQVEEVDELAELVEKSADEPVPPLVKKSSFAGTSPIPTHLLDEGKKLGLKNSVFDIPIVYNQSVQKWMDYFLGKGKNWFVLYCERAGRYAPMMGKILEDHGLPRDLIFLSMAESGFANKAKSHASAVGPWQFMKYTGLRYGLNIDFYVDERRDPIKATIAASKYLKKLYEEFGDWALAKAGYNAGEGKMNRAIRKYRTENFWDISKGRYLKPETKNYVPKIMALAIIGKNLETYGMGDIEFYDPLDFDEVMVPGNTDLIALAQALELPFEEIQELNPELLRWQTPPHIEQYPLRLPVGHKEKFSSCCKDQTFSATQYATHKVAKKTTIEKLAKQYKVPVVVLAELNQLPSSRASVGAGDVVLLPFREGQNFKDEMYADLYERPRKSKRRRSSRFRRAKKSTSAIQQEVQKVQTRKLADTHFLSL